MRKVHSSSFTPIARAKATCGSTLNKRCPKVMLFGNFIKSANAKSAFVVFYSNCSSQSDFCLNQGKQRPKVMLFGNFIKSANAKSAFVVFYSNCSSQSDFCLNLGKTASKSHALRQFHKIRQCEKRIRCLLLQLLEPKRYLVQPF
jgi:hypothetical protein